MVKVSIIIPHFNRFNLLEETILSVINQTYKYWEIIIVDDGSQENEFKCLKNYDGKNNIKVFERKNEKKGPSSCRNIGIKNAVGDYIIFLDSDDLLAPFCLEQRINVVLENPSVNIAVFLIENFTSVIGDTKAIFNKIVPKEELSSFFLKNENPWQTMAPIWKKDFILSLGGFDEDLIFMEDPEMHLRAINSKAVNMKLCYNEPADCYYRISNMDVTKNEFYFNSIFYRILFYKKILSEKQNCNYVKENLPNIKFGIYKLVSTFLYARSQEFPKLLDEFETFIKTCNLFTHFELFRLLFLLKVGNSKSLIAKKLKIKGICFKLLPKS